MMSDAIEQSAPKFQAEGQGLNPTLAFFCTILCVSICLSDNVRYVGKMHKYTDMLSRYVIRTTCCCYIATSNTGRKKSFIHAVSMVGITMRGSHRISNLGRQR